MKTFIKFNFYLLLFLLTISKFVYPQNLNNPIILFETSTSKGKAQISFSENILSFKIDNSVISRVFVNGSNFLLLKGLDGNSFGVANFYFGQKSEISFLEIYLLDDDFKVTLYKKLNFFYEESLPKILQISSQEFVLLFPTTGQLKIYNSNTEKVFELIKDEENKIFQERIGHLTIVDNNLLVFLSQIKKGNDYFSKIFSIDLKTFEINQVNLDIDIIYKIFQSGYTIYFSGIDIEPVFQGGFYFIELDSIDFKNSKIIKNSNLFIEGRVKNTKDIFFSQDCFYKLSDKILEKLSLCLSNEIIIDALYAKEKYYVLTRKELKQNLYELNSNFEILREEYIEQYLGNPELSVLSSNNLIVKDKNKIVFAKNLAEE